MKFDTLIFLCCNLALCTFDLGARAKEDNGAEWKAELNFAQFASTVERELESPGLIHSLLEFDALLKGADSSTDELMMKIHELERVLKETPCENLPFEVAVADPTSQQAQILCEILAELAKARLQLGVLPEQDVKAAACSCTTFACNGITPISGPLTITLSGRYCLTADISGLITIAASNVDLDLNGFTIFASGFAGIIINPYVSNVKIANGSIVAASPTSLTGISGFMNISDIVVENLSFGTTSNGFQDEPLFFLLSSNVTCRNIFIPPGVSGLFGIFFRGSDNSTVVSSQISGGSGGGINYFPTLNNNNITIEDCVIENGETGIAFGTTSQAFINRTTIINTAGSAITSVSPLGIGVPFLENCIIKNTLIDTSGTNGMLFENVSNLQIENCQIRNTAEQGIALSNVQNVEIDSCEVLNSLGAPLAISNLLNGSIANSLFSTTVGIAPLSAVQISDSQGFQVQNCVLRAFVLDPMLAGSNGLSIQNCTGFIVAGSTIQTNALGTDSTGGNGILVANNSFNGVIQDCILPNILPNMSNMGIFVTGNSQGISIEECTVDGAYKTGIRIEGLLGGVVQNTLVTSTQTGSGITLIGANGIALFGNTVAGNGTHGIHLEKETINCILRGNSVTNNKKIGINNHSQNSSNTIYHNFAQENGKRNYEHVDLVASPKKRVGVLENISR